MGSRTSLSDGPLFLGSLLFIFPVGGFKPNLHNDKISSQRRGYNQTVSENPRIPHICYVSLADNNWRSRGPRQQPQEIVSQEQHLGL